ncbi:hypothetical protein [Iningainema tapete]|uniref:Uncharacterized protein n=1 Tax=Iningainema tapete BLCC-T55 TaxID=2748662 RepID=A0A8J7C488_9CYAN|nr:hypothetical protein [Iningainema tapete]MBD2771134.1 hypothetical protein [Iningainema tapete BLCC-T55]
MTQLLTRQYQLSNSEIWELADDFCLIEGSFVPSLINLLAAIKQFKRDCADLATIPFSTQEMTTRIESMVTRQLMQELRERN